MQDGPYGYSDDAEPFDAAIAAWVETLEPSHLLEEARRRQGGAKSCGFTGYVLLHGMMARARGGESSEFSDGLRGSSISNAWEGQLLAASHPTYYGMAVGTFRRRAADGAASR